MNKNTSTEKIALLDPISRDVVGQVSVDMCKEDSQIVIHEVEPKNPGCPVSLLSTAFRMIINELFTQQYKSAVAWPSSADERTSAILKGAGFRRTGLFMRRSAFNEDGHIEFHPPCASNLDDFLNAHARKIAEQTAAHSFHDPGRVYAHVRQEYQERFSDGPCSDDEAILTVDDVETHETVGLVWTSFRQEGPDRAAFVEEIEIFESKRGKKYGTRAIRALGNSSFGRIIDVVSLFVQPENVPAYALYRKLEFKPGRLEFVCHASSTQQSRPADGEDAAADA